LFFSANTFFFSQSIILCAETGVDLTGLRRPWKEAKAFLEDNFPPDAYEKLVNIILGSPLSGERWGSNVVRFG